MSMIRTATAADDAALRTLLRETPMQGRIGMAFEREPSFFAADIDALHHDAVLLGDAGCGSRVLRAVWWQGREATAAYLSDLRIHPRHQRRSGVLLRRAFEFADELAAQRPAEVTWTAIFEENAKARRVLEDGRAGMPLYHDRGRLICPTLMTRRGKVLPCATDADWQEITRFLNETLRDRPLAPHQTEQDFRDGKRWPGLWAEDFLVVRRHGRIVGAVAVYDVRQIRQVRIHQVPMWMRWLRGPSRLLSRVSGWPAIPAADEILPMAFASFLAVADNNVGIGRELLMAARSEAASRGIGFLCVCLHQGDPLAVCLKGLPAISSHGRLYEVTRGEPMNWGVRAPVVEGVAL